MIKKNILISSLTAATLISFSACSDGDQTTYEAGATLPTTEIRIPSVTFSGVLQDKYGDAIVSHKVCIGNSCVDSDEQGVFTISNINVASGVNVGNGTFTPGQGTTVTLVTPDVVNENGNATHLGLTATISVDRFLASVYNNGQQDYFTTLDGKTIYAGVIQLPQLGAYLSGRFENKATGESITTTDKAYFTMADESTLANNDGEEKSDTANAYTIISNKERVFTIDINKTNGEFKASGLPFMTNFDVKLSGYNWTTNGRDANFDAIATLDNSISYSIGDVELNKEADMGDDVGVQFIAINNALGDGDYTLSDFTLNGNKSGVVTASNSLLPNNFIAPSKSITLKFSEKIDASKIDKNSVKYVRSMSDKAFTAYSEIAVLTDKQNSNNNRLASTFETMLEAENALTDYTDGENNLTATDATFVALYNTYLTAVRSVVKDVNGTSSTDTNAAGSDLIANHNLISADNNTSLSRTAADLNASVAVNMTPRGLLTTTYSLVTTANSATGKDIATKTEYFNSLSNIYTNHAVTAVKMEGESEVTIDLATTLPSNNVVTIGLQTFDFADASGNILQSNYTLNDNTPDNLAVKGYITEIDVGTAE